MYATTYKELRDSLQPSSKETGEEDAAQAEQNKRRKRDKISEHEYCTRKQKRPPPTYKNPRSVATNDFFAPLRDLPMENAERGSERNSTKTPGINVSTGKGRHLPSY
jgi:hypothetical protein